MSPSSIRILFFICKAFQSWLCLPLHQYLSPFSPLRLKCLPQWALSVHPTHLLLPTLMSLHFLFSTKNDFPSPLHNTLSILWYLGWNIASSRSLPWPLHLQKKQSIPNPLPANKHTHTQSSWSFLLAYFHQSPCYPVIILLVYLFVICLLYQQKFSRVGIWSVTLFPVLWRVSAWQIPDA